VFDAFNHLAATVEGRLDSAAATEPADLVATVVAQRQAA
jgi:glycerol-3-phosphate O-acyltransferase